MTRNARILLAHAVMIAIVGSSLVWGAMTGLRAGPMLALAAPLTLLFGSLFAFLSLDRSVKASLCIIVFSGYMSIIQFIGSIYLIVMTSHV